jgi:hypothetical protein
VRAKRDAEDADREYRRAVHWLETLRIRRAKILEAGYKSMELFVAELAGAMKGVLERYTDNMTCVLLPSRRRLLSDSNKRLGLVWFGLVWLDGGDENSATMTTQTQLATHLRAFVDRIAPGADAAALASRLPRALASSVPRPTLYYNYRVGECEDLLFGVSLVDYATSRALADGDMPKIVRLCIAEIEARGLDAEGIYRVRAARLVSFSRGRRPL